MFSFLSIIQLCSFTLNVLFFKYIVCMLVCYPRHPIFSSVFTTRADGKVDLDKNLESLQAYQQGVLSIQRLLRPSQLSPPGSLNSLLNESCLMEVFWSHFNRKYPPPVSKSENRKIKEMLRQKSSAHIVLQK